jgi:hypothetical protein
MATAIVILTGILLARVGQLFFAAVASLLGWEWSTAGDQLLYCMPKCG